MSEKKSEKGNRKPDRPEPREAKSSKPVRGRSPRTPAELLVYCLMTGVLAMFASQAVAMVWPTVWLFMMAFLLTYTLVLLMGGFGSYFEPPYLLPAEEPEVHEGTVEGSVDPYAAESAWAAAYATEAEDAEFEFKKPMGIPYRRPGMPAPNQP